MSDPLKTLIDIRDRAQLAIEGMREAEPAKDELPEPKWFTVSQGFNFLIGEKVVGTVRWNSTGARWKWNCIAFSESCKCGDINAAKGWVERTWVLLPDARKRELLGISRKLSELPKPDAKAEPLPTPLPDAVTRAAIELVEVACRLSYVDHELKAVLERAGIPTHTPSALMALHESVDAYRAAKAAAVDGAGKAVQS